MIRLDRRTVQLWLANSPAWRHDELRDSITRCYRFADFANAFAFMSQLALHAEAANHHPEWSNVYDRVTVTWITHDVGGLSRLDLEMAQVADDAFARFGIASALAD